MYTASLYYLFSGVNSVFLKNWLGLSCHPNTGQGVRVNFVVFDLSAAFLMDINAAMLSVVDFVVTDDGVAKV